MRDVRIKKVMNGFVVEVGCQILVFNDTAVFLAELARYLTNPDEVEKEYVTKLGIQVGYATEAPPPAPRDPYAGEQACVANTRRG